MRLLETAVMAAGARAAIRGGSSMARAMAVADILLMEDATHARPLTRRGHKQPLGTTSVSSEFKDWLEQNRKNRGIVVGLGPWFLREKSAGKCISCSGLYLVMEGSVPQSHTHLSVLPTPPGTLLAEEDGLGGARRRHGQLLPSPEGAARFTVTVYGSLAKEATAGTEETFDSDLSRSAAYTDKNSPLMRLCCTTAALSPGEARKTLIVENAVWCNEELQGKYMADMEPILTAMLTGRHDHDDDDDTWFTGELIHAGHLTPTENRNAMWIITQRNVLQMVQRQLMLVAFLAGMDFVQMAWNLHEPNDINVGQVFFPPATGSGEVDEGLQVGLVQDDITSLSFLPRNAWIFTNEVYAAQVAYVSTRFHGLQDSVRPVRPAAKDEMRVLHATALGLRYLTYRGQGEKATTMQGTKLFATSSGSEPEYIIDGIEAFGVIIPYDYLRKMASAEEVNANPGWPNRPGIAELSDIQVDLCENLLRAVTAGDPRPQGRPVEIHARMDRCEILVAGRPVARIEWTMKSTSDAKAGYADTYTIAFGSDSDVQPRVTPKGHKIFARSETVIINSVFVSPEFRQHGFFGQLMCVAYKFAAIHRAHVLYNVWLGGTVMGALRRIPHILQSEALWLKNKFPPLPENTGPAAEAAVATAADGRLWREKLDNVLTRALTSLQSCKEVAERKPRDMSADFFKIQSKATFRVARQSSFVRMMAHMAFLYNFGVFKAIKSTRLTPDLVLGKGSSVIIFVNGTVVQQCIDALLPPSPPSASALAASALCTTCDARPALYHSKQQYLCAEKDCAVDASVFQILATHGLEHWM